MHRPTAAAVLGLAACGPATAPIEPASDGTGSTGSPIDTTGIASDGLDATTGTADATSSGPAGASSTDTSGGTVSGWGAPEEVWVFDEPNALLWTMSGSSSPARLDIGSGTGRYSSGHWALLLPAGPAIEVTQVGGPTASAEDAAYWWGATTAYRQAFADGAEPEPLIEVDGPRSVAAVADGAVFMATMFDDGHHLFHVPLTGDATDLGPILGPVVTPISNSIAGDGSRVWLEIDGRLQFVDLAAEVPALVAVGGAQSDPGSKYLWATDDAVLSHNGVEVSARAKTDGELLWSEFATGDVAAVRGDGDLIVWTSSTAPVGQTISVFATTGFDEREKITTLEGIEADLVLTEDALYVLYTPGSDAIVVRLERPDAP